MSPAGEIGLHLDTGEALLHGSLQALDFIEPRLSQAERPVPPRATQRVGPPPASSRSPMETTRSTGLSADHDGADCEMHVFRSRTDPITDSIETSLEA